MKKEIKRNPDEVLDARLNRLQHRREFRQILIECIVLAGLIYVLLHYIIGIALVSGSSMEPALSDGELVIFYRLDQEYQKGDIVIIQRENDIQYVKRIAARGNERIEIDEDGGETPFDVPAGSYYVLGDNREDSIDSRSFGAVKKEEIVGRVIFHGGVAR